LLPRSHMGPGISNVPIIQRTARHYDRIGQCDHGGHVPRWSDGGFDFRRIGCEGQTCDRARGSGNSRQGRSVACSPKGSSLLVARLAELRTELSIRYQAALRRNANCSDHRPSLNDDRDCSTPVCAHRLRLPNSTVDTCKFELRSFPDDNRARFAMQGFACLDQIPRNRSAGIFGRSCRSTPGRENARRGIDGSSYPTCK